MSTELKIKDLRKELKVIGYKLKIQTFSSFKGADILDSAGYKINGSQWFGSKDEAQLWREKHAKALDIKAKYEGNLFDNGWRVVL